jgi:hypothetical protein
MSVHTLPVLWQPSRDHATAKAKGVEPLTKESREWLRSVSLFEYAAELRAAGLHSLYTFKALAMKPIFTCIEDVSLYGLGQLPTVHRVKNMTYSKQFEREGALGHSDYGVPKAQPCHVVMILSCQEGFVPATDETPAEKLGIWEWLHPFEVDDKGEKVAPSPEAAENRNNKLRQALAEDLAACVEIQKAFITHMKFERIDDTENVKVTFLIQPGAHPRHTSWLVASFLDERLCDSKAVDDMDDEEEEDGFKRYCHVRASDAVRLRDLKECPQIETVPQIQELGLDEFQLVRFELRAEKEEMAAVEWHAAEAARVKVAEVDDEEMRAGTCSGLVQGPQVNVDLKRSKACNTSSIIRHNTGSLPHCSAVTGRGLMLDAHVVTFDMVGCPIIVEYGKIDGKMSFKKMAEPPEKLTVSHQIYLPGFGIFDNTNEVQMEEVARKAKMRRSHRNVFKAAIRNLRNREQLPNWTTKAAPFVHQ